MYNQNKNLDTINNLFSKKVDESITPENKF